MRKIWKKSLVTALAMALAVSSCVPVMAAGRWREDTSGWYYENSDGSLQKGWLQDIDGKWYFLDNATGVMKTGWIQDVDSVWYYTNASGAMQIGWVNDNGTWYYTNVGGQCRPVG